MSAVPLTRALSDMVEPAFRELPARMASDEARVMLLAIGLQESRFRHRLQMPLRPGMPPGPARGFWQFERGGGVRGVMGHPASSRLALEVISSRNLRPNSPTVWAALATDDVLAAMLDDAEGPRSVQAFQRRLQMHVLALESVDEACLVNCNTPEQWEDVAS